MILGILSDSHGRAARTALALRLLRACGAERFVHCGDIGSTEVLSEFVGLNVHFVWGNNDDPHGPLARYARSLGLALPTVPVELALGGRKIVVIHGHEHAFAELWRGAASTAPTGDRPEYVLYGHSHVPADERRGGARFINPGALHRAPLFTVATLDLASDAVTHWEVRDDWTAGNAAHSVPLAR